MLSNWRSHDELEESPRDHDESCHIFPGFQIIQIVFNEVDSKKPKDFQFEESKGTERGI